MPFATLGLSPALCTPLARLGYTQPTPVQLESIPVVLSGSDLLARAQTGTGKTAAFGLPMIDRLLLRARRRAAARKPRGLVLAPTRELALQLHTALTTYGASVNLKATAIFGGVSMRPQVQALQRGTDVVVATPGRLIDHLQHRTIDLSAVEILTVDEADRMLDMGFPAPAAAHPPDASAGAADAAALGHLPERGSAPRLRVHSHAGARGCLGSAGRADYGHPSRAPGV